MAKLERAPQGTPLEVSSSMDREHMDRELTSDSVLSALRKQLLQVEHDLEIKPPPVIWATPDGREKLLSR